jgi:hypothetical protein
LMPLPCICQLTTQMHRRIDASALHLPTHHSNAPPN